MNCNKIFLILFSFLIISSVCVNQKNEIQKSYKKMFRLMQQTEGQDLQNSLSNEIYYFSMIGLVFVLYFSVMALINMNIQKSSILYAKYGTSKSQIE
jgi:sterol desaturase/sphingolipid hydroxylase (fatty acid hydroxylase superfamily)